MGNTKESTKRKVADRVLEILRQPDVATTGTVRFQKVLDRRGMKLRDGFVLLIH